MITKEVSSQPVDKKGKNYLENSSMKKGYPLWLLINNCLPAMIFSLIGEFLMAALGRWGKYLNN
jgi:hypothetical protein